MCQPKKKKPATKKNIRQPKEMFLGPEVRAGENPQRWTKSNHDRELYANRI